MPPMFDFNTFDISAEEMSLIEEFFGFQFNASQKDYIRYWRSTDIQACPGSGKTTCLAAKLILLSQRLSSNLGHGICVITHTNTAVDEITKKIGASTKFYNSYPHHLGTIQSFVNKFLAIPYYKGKLHKSLHVVDANEYASAVNRFIQGSKQKYALLGTEKFLENKEQSIAYFVFNAHNFEISSNVNDIERIQIPGIKDLQKIEKHYANIKTVKQGLLRDGIITFDEAYALAFKYLRETPGIKELFSKRFSLVFIDEMQDMEYHQYRLLGELFSETTTIFQRIGDTNQSIFSIHSKQENSEWTPKPNPDVALLESARLSDNIAQLIKNVCMHPQVGLKGWNNPDPIKPKILLFDDKTIHAIKDVFGKVIVDNNLHLKGNGVFKIVGMRKSQVKAGHLNLQSYWPEFFKGEVTKSESFPNLISYLEKCQFVSKTTKNVKAIRKILLQCMCNILKTSAVKDPLTQQYFTPYKLDRYIKTEALDSKFDFSKRLMNWILLLEDPFLIQEDFASLIEVVLKHFNKAVSSEMKTFLEANDSEFNGLQQIKTSYSYSKEPIVDIHFDTVHSTKGETHCATLFVETTTNGVFDIGGKILDFICSDTMEQEKSKKKSANTALRKRLPISYVAMSRPSHCLCLALHKERYSEEHKAYFAVNTEWEVVVI
jgi:DNA helicase-2/ATP-dependent DNA helicase PcrA